MSEQKDQIDKAMARIARRKPGHSRLVHDKKTGTIRVKGQHGQDKGDSGVHVHD